MRIKIGSISVVTVLVLAMMVTVDLGFGIVQNIEAPPPRIIFVDDVPGSGPGNPPEDYTSIQDAIDAASDGDTVFVYNGVYFENIDVDRSINLTGEDRDSTIIMASGIGNVVHVISNWVNISGFTVTNGGEGIELHNVHNCSVSNNIAQTNNLYGIVLYGSYNNNITSNIVQRNYDGIHVGSSIGNNITGNIIDKNIRDGIGVSLSFKNRLVNNNISSNGKDGIDLITTHEITLKDNKMENNGIFISGDIVKNWNTHNIDTSNTVNGMPVQYWKNRTAGKVPEGAGQVILANCTNVSVEGQEIYNASSGIILGFSSNNSITRNNVSSNSVYGIYLYLSNENNISSNVASYNNEGMYLQRSNANQIIGNMIFANELYGIGFSYYSSANQIIGNMIFSNELNGISIYYYSENLIIGNTISYNGGIGIFIDSNTLNSSIYHNNFINNSVQAVDDTNDGNQWDNGYPSGGNFWSDYDGVDLNSTPSQDGPPPDGIGDTPYIIDFDSQDNYPLMELIFNRTFLYEGWNLISIPFNQNDNNLEVVLDSIKGSYDAVQWYNVSDTSDLWKHNHILKPSHLNDLNEINHTMGFWIHITEPGGVLFEYNGIKPTQNQSIPLNIGWNLVGYPSLTSYNRSHGLNNIMYGPDVDCIQWYDASSQSWHFMGPDDLFLPGRGYWVHSKVDTNWDVPL